MELAGLPTITSQSRLAMPADLPVATDPYSYVISKNIRRRHLTKQQQADLIVKVMKAAAGTAKTADPVKPRNQKGQFQGQSSRDEVKAKAFAEGKKHNISQRTMERAFANDRASTGSGESTDSGRGKEKPHSTRAENKQKPRPDDEELTLEEVKRRLQESEKERLRIAKDAQKEIGRLESVVTDYERKIASLTQTVERLRAKNQKTENEFKDYKASTQKRIADLRQELATRKKWQGGFDLWSNGSEGSQVYREVIKKYHPDSNSDKNIHGERGNG
jgi:hypothetical protein